MLGRNDSPPHAATAVCCHGHLCRAERDGWNFLRSIDTPLVAVKRNVKFGVPCRIFPLSDVPDVAFTARYPLPGRKRPCHDLNRSRHRRRSCFRLLAQSRRDQHRCPGHETGSLSNVVSDEGRERCRAEMTPRRDEQLRAPAQRDRGCTAATTEASHGSMPQPNCKIPWNCAACQLDSRCPSAQHDRHVVARLVHRLPARRHRIGQRGAGPPMIVRYRCALTPMVPRRGWYCQIDGEGESERWDAGTVRGAG